MPSTPKNPPLVREIRATLGRLATALDDLVKIKQEVDNGQITLNVGGDITTEWQNADMPLIGMTGEAAMIIPMFNDALNEVVNSFNPNALDITRRIMTTA